MKRKEVQKIEMSEKLLDILEASVILGVHKLTVYRHVKNGTLKAIRVFNKWKIPETELIRIKNK